MMLAWLLEKLLGPLPGVSVTVTPLPPPPPVDPSVMPCPACAGWGRERRQFGHTCEVCDGQGSAAVREPVRP